MHCPDGLSGTVFPSSYREYSRHTVSSSNLPQGLPYLRKSVLSKTILRTSGVPKHLVTEQSRGKRAWSLKSNMSNMNSRASYTLGYVFLAYITALLLSRWGPSPFFSHGSIPLEILHCSSYFQRTQSGSMYTDGSRKQLVRWDFGHKSLIVQMAIRILNWCAEEDR